MSIVKRTPIFQWLCPGILSATHHSLAPATHDLAGHPFSYPRNRLNPAEAPRTAAQRFFDLPDLTFSVVDQAVRSDVPFDLTDGFAFQAFNDLVEGTYLSTAAFRLAFRRRWEVNTFVETCDIHNQPSLSTPPLYAANMWSVQFIFEVDVDAGAQNDYDFSWADLHAIAPLFTSLRTASFFVDFVQDDVIDFVNEDLANLTGVEGMLAHVVDGIRTSLPRVGNRRIAIEDAESGDVTSDGDASGLAPAQVAPLLLDNLAIAYRI